MVELPNSLSKVCRPGAAMPLRRISYYPAVAIGVRWRALAHDGHALLRASPRMGSAGTTLRKEASLGGCPRRPAGFWGARTQGAMRSLRQLAQAARRGMATQASTGTQTGTLSSPKIITEQRHLAEAKVTPCDRATVRPVPFPGPGRARRLGALSPVFFPRIPAAARRRTGGTRGSTTPRTATTPSTASTGSTSRGSGL